MTDTVSDRIKAAEDGLTRTERRIGQALLGQYPVLGLQTLARIAAAAHTTAPTVLRFVTKIGFANYSAFQDALRSELQPTQQSPLTRYAPGEADADDDFLGAFAKAASARIRASAALVQPATLDAVCALLADPAKPVLCVGGRFSTALAETLATYLLELRPGVASLRGQTATWPAQLLDVTRKHVVVAFDFRRYQDDVIRFCELAAERGADVVLFTDQWMSPNARFAKHVLVSQTATTHIYDSTAAAFVQLEAIVAGVARKIGDRSKDRLSQLEALRERLG